MRKWSIASALIAAAFLTGCKSQSSMDTASAPAPAVVAEKPLYDRLGGDPAIKAVVDDFTGRAAADPKVNFFRKGTGREWNPTPEQLATFKLHLVQFIEMNTGGPQTYQGQDMKVAHAGMMITNAEFDALAADLSATLDQFKVPSKEKTELMTIVASTREKIVQNP